MSGSPRVVVACFLVLQFSLFSAVDIWAMVVPMVPMSHTQMQGDKGGMTMGHCQTEIRRQCHCTSCACIPLVIGAAIPVPGPSLVFDRLFADLSPRLYQGYLLPPFRPPIG